MGFLDERRLQTKKYTHHPNNKACLDNNQEEGEVDDVDEVVANLQDEGKDQDQAHQGEEERKPTGTRRIGRRVAVQRHGTRLLRPLTGNIKNTTIRSSAPVARLALFLEN